MTGLVLSNTVFNSVFLEKTMAFFFGFLLFILPLSGGAAEFCVAMILLTMFLRLTCFGDRRAVTRGILTSPFTVSALLFWVLMIPSLLGAGEYSQKALRALVSKWGEALLIYIAAAFTFSRVRSRDALLALLAGGAVVCADALFQRATGSDLLRGLPMLLASDGATYGVTATFHHYTDLGSYIILPLFTALGFLLLRKDPAARRVGMWVAPVLLLVLFLTYSRSAWVAVAAGIGCLSLIFQKRERRLSLLLLALVMTVLIGVPALRERILFIFAPYGDQDRFRMWHAAWLMFAESPLWGKGLGTFMTRITAYKTIMPIYAHNCYFQILAETGLLGFSGFMGVAGVFALRAREYLVRFPGDRFFRVMVAGIVAFMVAMFFETQLYSVKTSLLFWTLLGICSGYTIKNEKESVIPDK